jgi:hypothetical protein
MRTLSKRGYWARDATAPISMLGRILFVSPLGWGFWVIALGLALWNALKAFADVMADSCEVWWSTTRRGR